ncbi:hypothetical protein ElyMa_000654500, partial [Elysia marginata]
MPSPTEPRGDQVLAARPKQTDRCDSRQTLKNTDSSDQSTQRPTDKTEQRTTKAAKQLPFW